MSFIYWMLAYELKVTLLSWLWCLDGSDNFHTRPNNIWLYLAPDIQGCRLEARPKSVSYLSHTVRNITCSSKQRKHRKLGIETASSIATDWRSATLPLQKNDDENYSSHRLCLISAILGRKALSSVESWLYIRLSALSTDSPPSLLAKRGARYRPLYWRTTVHLRFGVLKLPMLISSLSLLWS